MSSNVQHSPADCSSTPNTQSHVNHPSGHLRRPILCRPGLSNCNSNVFQNFLTEWLMQFRIECESVITNFFEKLLPTVFYGTGFGPRIKESQYAAAKSVVICLYNHGLIPQELLQSMQLAEQQSITSGLRPGMSSSQAKVDLSKHPQWFYSKRLMNSFMELVKKESFPAGFKEGKPDFNSHLEALHQLLKQFQTVKPAYGVCPQINNQAVAVPSPTIATPKVAQPSSTPVTVSHYGQPFRRTPLIASNPPLPPINNVVEPREGNNVAENETPRRKVASRESSPTPASQPVCFFNAIHENMSSRQFSAGTTHTATTSALSSGNSQGKQVGGKSGRIASSNMRQLPLQVPKNRFEGNPGRPAPQINSLNNSQCSSKTPVQQQPEFLQPSNANANPTTNNVSLQIRKRASSADNLPDCNRYELQRRNRINSTPVHGSNTAYGPIPIASSPVKLEGHNNHNVCSSDNSTQLCDALAGGLNKPDVINTQPFDWTTHYGVYPDPNSTAVYSDISAYNTNMLAYSLNLTKRFGTILPKIFKMMTRCLEDAHPKRLE
uniref:Uncharacterized protein n=1 Tax=Ditylenchus dipsaci TaxID=166011 RepID=A0A915ERP8_9BILA